MPLLKGSNPKVFEHNFKVERKAGKPMKQSLAIAYAMKKKKKMAKGGMMHGEDCECPNCCTAIGRDPSPEVVMNGPAHAEAAKDLNQHMPMTKEDMYDDLVDRIMQQHSKDFSSEARLSEGGMVANGGEDEDLADFSPNEFDDLALRDDLESSYTGANSGDELGDEQEDEDRKDIVARIMKSRAKKDKLPRPA
jgi:hypothetical protein